MGVASVLRCMPFVRPSPSLCPSRFFGEFFEDTFHATLHERLSFSIHLSHVCRPLFPSCCCFFLLSDFFLFLLHLFFSLLPSSVLLHFGLFVELLHGVGSCVAFSLAWMGMFIHLLGWVQFRIVVASIFLSLVWFHGRLGVCTADVRRSCMFLRLFLLDLFTVRWRVPSFFSQQFSILDFPHEVSIPFLFQRCRPRMRRSHVRPSESYRGTRTCPFIVVDVVRTFPMSRVSSLFLRAMVFVCFSFGTCAHILRWSSLFRFFSRGCCSSPPTPIGLILVFLFSFHSLYLSLLLIFSLASSTSPTHVCVYSFVCIVMPHLFSDHICWSWHVRRCRDPRHVGFVPVLPFTWTRIQSNGTDVSVATLLQRW